MTNHTETLDRIAELANNVDANSREVYYCTRSLADALYSAAVPPKTFLEGGAVDTLRVENERLKLAIKDLANLESIESFTEIRMKLLAISGARHHHVSSIEGDQCSVCKYDLWDEIHNANALR